jgi:ABC-2 type transport system permease protein/lipopolysaccharide transport system permease protein
VSEVANPWTDNAASGEQLLPWGELWRARELVVIFAQRDLRVRYKQAVFGVGWVVVQPVITVLAFTLVFDRLAVCPPVMSRTRSSPWQVCSGGPT